MTATETKLLSADDLLRLYSKGERGELIRGVCCETEPEGAEHGRVLATLGALLASFVQTRRLGRLAMGSGIWLDHDPDTVRKADIAYFAPGRLDGRVTGYAEVLPDLVAEVESFTDGRNAIFDKSHMWLSSGVRLAWAVYPESRTVAVHRPGERRVMLAAGDDLDGEDVLPGFSCTVSAVFDE